MRPEDQLVLRDCMRRKSLLDSFLDCKEEHRYDDWFQSNVAMFMQVCEVHGKVATQHHERLVHKFIEGPAEAGAHMDQADLTASGPPLAVLLKGLRKLCDMRCAAPSTEGFNTRFKDMQSLRDCLL